jgi:hypothetical protein
MPAPLDRNKKSVKKYFLIRQIYVLIKMHSMQMQYVQNAIKIEVINTTFDRTRTGLNYVIG